MPVVVVVADGGAHVVAFAGELFAMNNVFLEDYSRGDSHYLCCCLAARARLSRETLLPDAVQGGGLTGRTRLG